MRRWTIRILLCLLLGVVMTVGVAGGSAVLVGFADTRSSAHGIRVSETGASNMEMYHRVSACRAQWFRSRKTSRGRSRGPLPESLRPDWIDREGKWRKDANIEMWVAEARGWPMPALWSKPRVWYEALDGTRPKLAPEGAIELPLSPFGSGGSATAKVLPLRPIIGGFLINTLFYTPIWLGLFFGLTAVRRRRGRCPQCGYDLRRELENGCPECGWNRK